MENQNDKKSKIFFIIISISQIVCGIVGCWVLWGPGTGIGWGIWNAIMFIASGIVGFCASCSPSTRCM